MSGGLISLYTLPGVSFPPGKKRILYDKIRRNSLLAQKKRKLTLLRKHVRAQSSPTNFQDYLFSYTVARFSDILHGNYLRYRSNLPLHRTSKPYYYKVFFVRCQVILKISCNFHISSTESVPRSTTGGDISWLWSPCRSADNVSKHIFCRLLRQQRL